MPIAQDWLDENYLLEWRDTVENLDVSKEELTGTLNLNDFVNLVELKCSNNQLSELIISDCKKLKKLNCGNNKLVSLDLSNNEELENLSLYKNNKIKTLDLSNNENLVSLVCTGNYKLCKLIISPDNSLTKIHLNNAFCLDPSFLVDLIPEQIECFELPIDSKLSKDYLQKYLEEGEILVEKIKKKSQNKDSEVTHLTLLERFHQNEFQEDELSVSENEGSFLVYETESSFVDSIQEKKEEKILGLGNQKTINFLNKLPFENLIEFFSLKLSEEEEEIFQEFVILHSSIRNKVSSRLIEKKRQKLTFFSKNELEIIEQVFEKYWDQSNLQQQEKEEYSFSETSNQVFLERVESI